MVVVVVVVLVVVAVISSDSDGSSGSSGYSGSSDICSEPQVGQRPSLTCVQKTRSQAMYSCKCPRQAVKSPS